MTAILRRRARTKAGFLLALAAVFALTLAGTAAAAAIRGTAGDDNLVGTAGPDVIRGLAGNDTLGVVDKLDCGRGFDVARITGNDSVLDETTSCERVVKVSSTSTEEPGLCRAFARTLDLRLLGLVPCGTSVPERPRPPHPGQGRLR